MSSTKLLASVLLVLAVLFGQVGAVAAASPTQEATPITGTIQSITTETDANGVTTVLVTFLLADQTTEQTVRISSDYAIQLGLIDATTLGPVPLQDVPEGVAIDPTQVIPDEVPTEESVHPIAWLLAQFFFDGDPEMAGLIDSLHNGDFKVIGEDGTEQTLDQVFGFGVIAQALWMSKDSEGNADADVAGDILLAKNDKNYEAFFDAHPEYLDQSSDTIPTNWGQFKKLLADKKNNLGVVVSGQADQEQTTDPLLTEQHGNNKDKANKENKGKGKDKNKNHP